MFMFIYFQVYCMSHVPKSGPGHFDQNSVGIRQALNVPKSTNYVNDQIRGGMRGDIDGKLLYLLLLLLINMFFTWKILFLSHRWLVLHFPNYRLFCTNNQKPLSIKALQTLFFLFIINF